MSIPRNPFIKGYKNPIIGRCLCVLDDISKSVRLLPTHYSQVNSDYSSLVGKKVRYCNSYAYVISAEQPTSEDVIRECQRMGTVIDIMYQIGAKWITPTGNGDSLGFYPIEADAKKVVEKISFIEGVFGHYWRISSKHLPGPVLEHLIEFSFDHHPSQYSSMGIELFAKRDSKLIGEFTGLGVIFELPAWCGSSCRHYKKELENNNFDAAFIDIVIAAGKAGVGVLLFDREAQTIKQLPIYEDE